MSNRVVRKDCLPSVVSQCFCHGSLKRLFRNFPSQADKKKGKERFTR